MIYRDARSKKELILDHLPDIVTLCRRMFGHASDAEDATHEAVVAILRALPEYRGDGPVRHWLLKVALNAARHHRRGLGRKRQREKAMSDPDLASVEGESPLEAGEQQEALRGAIAELPEELREPVILHYFHKMTQVEIGALLSCSQKTVHTRLRKGVDLLNRRLAGSTLFGATAVATVLAGAKLDAVEASLVQSIEECVASTLASQAAASTAGASASGSAAGMGTAFTTGAMTGGIVMNAKTVMVIVGFAAASFLGGAFVSDGLLSDRDAREARIQELETDLSTERERVEGLEQDLESQRAESGRERDELALRLAGLESDLEARDAAIAELKRTRETVQEPEVAVSREQKWDKIQGFLAGPLKVLQEMQEEGANQFALGPKLVAELSKLSTEQYAEIMEFDAEETDPQILSEINAVMLQALIFSPSATDHRDEYMSRYLDRAEDGSYGENYGYGALRRISFSMPPFVDAYQKLVAPLDEELRGSYTDFALERASSTTATYRMDGAKFLGRVPEYRAAEGLMTLYQNSRDDAGVRARALQGLSHRADPRVLKFLQGYETSEQDPEVAKVLKASIASVTKLLEE